MKVIVSARHMDLTDSLKQYAEEHLGKVHTFGLKLITADIVLDVRHGKHCAKVNLHGSQVDVEAESKTEDMYESIHNVVSKLEKQIEKRAGHLIKHK